jgi:uncharacterized protein YggE
MRHLILAAVILLCAPVMAQDKAVQPGRTLLAIQETAERQVVPEQIEASFAMQFRGKTAAEAQAAVNKSMSRALDLLRGQGLDPRTGQYMAYPRWVHTQGAQGQVPFIEGWEAEQTVSFSSRDKSAMTTAATAMMTAGLAVRQFSYVLTKAQRKAEHDQLAAEAVATLKSRAEAIATAAGLRFTGWDRLTVNEGGFARPMMAMAGGMDMKASMPAPEIAAGLQTISITVNAEAILE